MIENTESSPELEVVSTSALEQMERAQTDIQITTAKRYPRQLSVVKKDMLTLATLDKATAETCFYTLRRRDPQAPGGFKVIQGPSARLAEIAVNSFGNIKAGSRIIGNDGRMITAQAVCHDLEKNVCISIEVKRRITTRDGKTFGEDMQVVTGNAACSIALRNAVFKVIPMALIKPIYDSAKKCAVGDAAGLAERRVSGLKKFEEIGVSNARVFATFDIRGLEDISLEILEQMIGTWTAIQDGDTTIEEAFPVAGKTEAPKFEQPKSAKTVAEVIKTAQVDPPGDASNAELNPAPKQEKVKRAKQTPSTPAEPAASTPTPDPTPAPSSSTVPADYQPDFDHPIESIAKLLERDGITEEQFNAYIKRIRLLKPDAAGYRDMLVSKAVSMFSGWKGHAEAAKQTVVAK
jgi:hypothetical protein